LEACSLKNFEKLEPWKCNFLLIFTPKDEQNLRGGGGFPSQTRPLIGITPQPAGKP
jgi:hypothetical protein